MNWACANTRQTKSQKLWKHRWLSDKCWPAARDRCRAVGHLVRLEWLHRLDRRPFIRKGSKQRKKHKNKRKKNQAAAKPPLLTEFNVFDVFVIGAHFTSCMHRVVAGRSINSKCWFKMFVVIVAAWARGPEGNWELCWAQTLVGLTADQVWDDLPEEHLSVFIVHDILLQPPTSDA